MTGEEALDFARKHIAVWNSHDLDAIGGLYSEAVELTSPLALAVRGDAVVRGRAELRAYAELGLRKFPELKFELIDVYQCVTSLTLVFRGAGGRQVAEVMFLDAEQKVARVFAHYRVGAGS